MDATTTIKDPASTASASTATPTMLNSIQAYVDSGKRAARAMNDGDMSRYDFEASWFRRAKALETGEAKVLAQQAYDEGYNYARVVPPVDRFI